MTGIVGCAGLPPTVAAINAKKNICLANKETLIAGGPAIVPLAVKNGVKILRPIPNTQRCFNACKVYRRERYAESS